MNIPAEFEIEKYSSAPLRLEIKSSFSVAPDLLFQTISDPHAVLGWVPLMKAVSMEHHKSDHDGECGVGSVRHCALRGIGDIDETIVWWNPPQGYAFKVMAKSKMMMPTKDHISVLLVEAGSDGGSILTWRHYFNWDGLLMRYMTALIFPMMLRGAFSNIRRQFGAKAENACFARNACSTEPGYKCK